MTASGISEAQIQVKWKAVPGAQRYKVFHVETAGGVRSLGRTKQLRFTHDGLEPNSTHAYVVKSLNVDGSSSYSVQAVATTADSDTAPATPSGLRGTVAFDRVELTWSPTTDTTSYDVLRSEEGDGTYAPLAEVVDPTIRDEDVAIAQTYRYAVRASGAEGTSGTSFPKKLLVPDCGQTLDALGVTWQVGTPQPIVPEPVLVSPPLNGVDYYTPGSSTPSSTLYMDCALAVALHRMSDASAGFELTEVHYFGIYNYRCIVGTGSPPDCVFNNSAYGRSIDIAALRDVSGTLYSVADDWVGEPSVSNTCTTSTADVKDEYLHEIVCAWFDKGAFDLILTPNYNAAHANHFSADVQDGVHFIE